MNKQKLREVTGLSSSSMAKLGKGESITTEMLVRICSKLDCDLTDIMELVDDKSAPAGWRVAPVRACPACFVLILRIASWFRYSMM